MTVGGVDAGGRVCSSVRSTSARRDFRYSSTVMTIGVAQTLLSVPRRQECLRHTHSCVLSRAVFRRGVLFVPFERLGHGLAFRVGKNQLDFFLHLFELLIAEPGEA